MKKTAAISLLVGLCLALVGAATYRSLAADDSYAALGELTPDLSGERAAKPHTLTDADYAAIETGMSYDRVVRILGRDGDELSKSNVGGIVTQMFIWRDPRGAAITVMFQRGVVVTKAHAGLKVGDRDEEVPLLR